MAADNIIDSRQRLAGIQKERYIEQAQKFFFDKTFQGPPNRRPFWQPEDQAGTDQGVDREQLGPGQWWWSTVALAAPVLVLFASRGLHHDLAGDGNGVGHHCLFCPQADLWL